MGAPREVLDTIDDPFVRRAVSSAYHVRRYLPFYVLGLVWALSLALVPTIRGDDRAPAGQAAVSAVDTGPRSSDEGTTDAAVPASGDVAASEPSVDSEGLSRGSVTPSRRAPIEVTQKASGKTRGGLDCKPGVRQLPVSSYATQCTARFTGSNGGATYRGVTGDKIRIVRRSFPDTANSQAASAIAEQAGFASEDTAKQVRDTFIPYFNRMFELYGRTVEWVDYESENGNGTEEAQSRGREGACADATKIEKELKAFGVSSSGDQFGECAAERKMIVFRSAAYFPESFYRKFHPYLWNTAMECERIIHQVFEYTDKRLAARKAKWAGDPVYQTQNRKFAIYIPDNDGYQRCGNIFEQRMKQGKAGGLAARYNYQLDLSRFPDQAAQGMVQFKAAGVTTVIQTCDPYSTLFMTQAAKSQNYFPEWQIIGVALQDTDNAARLYDQDEVRGHLFGLSQLGATTKLIGKTSEPGRLYKVITGKDIPEGTSGDYFGLVQIYNMLQAAGPNLTPEAIAAGAMTIIPGGAPDYPAGYWSYADGPDGTAGAGDHTMIDDSREVFWVSEPGTDTTPAQSANDPYFNGPDGNNGTYKETYGGRRFRNGEWSDEEPPIYPRR